MVLLKIRYLRGHISESKVKTSCVRIYSLEAKPHNNRFGVHWASAIPFIDE